MKNSKLTSIIIYFSYNIIYALNWFIHELFQFFTVFIPSYLGAKNKKNFLKVLFESTRLSFRWKYPAFHYFRYALYDKQISYNDAKEYIPESVYYFFIYPRINRELSLLSDKIVFDHIARSAGLSLPDRLFHIKNGVFFDGSNNILAGSNEQRLFLDRLPDTFFLKPSYYSSLGIGILRFSRKYGGAVHKDQKGRILDPGLIDSLKSEDWIAQAEVKQTKELAVFHKDSLNTVRVITGFSKTRGPEALFYLLKTGVDSNITDSCYYGALFVRIDPLSTRLSDTAYSTRNHKTFEKHPDSDISFSGKTINCLDSIKQLAEKAAAMFPDTAIIGWDIAVTEQGPVLIEGNNRPGLVNIQKTHGGVSKRIFEFYTGEK